MDTMSRSLSEAKLPSAREWNLSRMPPARRGELERPLPFEDIARQLNEDAVVETFCLKDAWDKAPAKTVRAEFKVTVDKGVSDILYNGRAGLRALYWASPELGDAATILAIRYLKPKLLSAIGDTIPRSNGGLEMTVGQIKHSLNLVSAKVWIDELYLYDDGEDLEVERWRSNNDDPRNCNPGLWLCTPRARSIKVMAAFLTGSGVEWIPEKKRDRAEQIHRFGFT